VDVIIGQLASGMSNEEVALEYGIEIEDVLAVLNYTARQFQA
jgi:uncharacterized protein (DUF433 family)